MRPSSSDSAQLFLFAYVKLMLSSFFLCSESNPSNVEKNSSYCATKYAVFNLISHFFAFLWLHVFLYLCKRLEDLTFCICFFTSASDSSLARIWPLLLACLLIMSFLKLLQPFRNSVCSATLAEVIRHHILSAWKCSQWYWSFHLRRNRHFHWDFVSFSVCLVCCHRVSHSYSALSLVHSWWK